MNSAGLSNSAATSLPALANCRLCLASLALMVGLTGNGCETFDNGAFSQTRRIDQNNPAVGQSAMRMYLRTNHLSQQPVQRQLLDEVGSRLAAAANRPEYDWRFELVDDPQPRIIVFPGANVVVSEGMIAACNNEAEFAAALAHELGHLVAGHQIQHATPGRSRTPENPHANVIRRDPQDELEADSIAMSLLARAGYDPQALLTFWQNADRNVERSAFVAAHGERSIHLAQLEESLVPAQQIYDANNHRQGLGIQIVRDETHREQRSYGLADETDLSEIRWTASNDHHGTGPRSDPHGAAKPTGWNADLLEEGDWMLPRDGEVQQVGYDWSATDRGQ